MKEKTIFELLGVSSDESEEAIKKAFREFAKIHHPDFFPGDKKREEDFKKVSLAYDRFKAEQIVLRRIRLFEEESRLSRRQRELFEMFKSLNLSDPQKHCDFYA